MALKKVLALTDMYIICMHEDCEECNLLRGIQGYATEVEDKLHVALVEIDRVYPADVFDGSSSDDGPLLAVEVRRLISEALGEE